MAYKQTWMDNSESPETSDKRERHIASNIASNMSGPGIGDLVAEKRANLIDKQGKPQIGRREPPEPYDPWPKRIMYIKGLLAGAVVIIATLVIILVAGMGSTIS